MRRLTVLYDARCELCRAARRWLERQARLVELEFVPAGSPDALERFPGLASDRTLEEIHVVGDGGEVYRGADAWLMCLWALRDYRGWSLKLAAPRHRHHARKLVAWVSRNRYRAGAETCWRDVCIATGTT